MVICWLKICFCLQWRVFYVWDRIKKGIKVLLAVVICWLKIYLVLLAVASIFITNMFDRWAHYAWEELKRESKFCLQWSFVSQKSLCFCLQWPVFYVWDRIKKEIKVLLAVVICWLKICFCLHWWVFYVWDRIKKGIKVLLAVVICWLKICLVLLAVASIFITNMSDR